MDCSTQIPACIAHRAKIPKGPSRYWRRIGYAGGICFEEEYLVDGIGVDCTGKEYKEDEQTSSCDQDQGAECEKRS